jgi:fructokinase
VAALLHRGVDKVILKEGRLGSTLYSGSESIDVPAVPREERDPTGAGDAFAGGIAYGLLHGLPPDTMLRFANTVGGFAVTRLGPMEGTPVLADVLRVVGLP